MELYLEPRNNLPEPPGSYFTDIDGNTGFLKRLTKTYCQLLVIVGLGYSDTWMGYLDRLPVLENLIIQYFDLATTRFYWVRDLSLTYPWGYSR